MRIYLKFSGVGIFFRARVKNLKFKLGNCYATKQKEDYCGIDIPKAESICMFYGEQSFIIDITKSNIILLLVRLLTVSDRKQW